MKEEKTKPNRVRIGKHTIHVSDVFGLTGTVVICGAIWYEHGVYKGLLTCGIALITWGIISAFAETTKKDKVEKDDAD